MLVSASTTARSESAEPGLDPEGERTPGLIADMSLEPECGLVPDDDMAQTPEKLGEGHVAELGRL